MTAMAAHKLQEAIFSALKKNHDLEGALHGVYDEAPTAVSYPYLSMGDTNIQVNDLKDRDGAQINFDLTVWSNEPSQMQVKELMTVVDEALSDADLIMSGFALISLRLRSAAVARQWNEEGSLYRGRLSYGALVYEK